MHISKPSIILTQPCKNVCAFIRLAFLGNYSVQSETETFNDAKIIT